MIASLAPGQSHCPTASETTLKYMDKMKKRKNCAYSMRRTVRNPYLTCKSMLCFRSPVSWMQRVMLKCNTSNSTCTLMLTTRSSVPPYLQNTTIYVDRYQCIKSPCHRRLIDITYHCFVYAFAQNFNKTCLCLNTCIWSRQSLRMILALG